MTVADVRTDRSLTDQERELMDYLEERLAEIDLTTLGSLDELADRMVAALPDQGAAWGEVIGPVYTGRGLQDWLGISRQAISQQSQSQRILRLTTADDIFVYPSFQFGPTGERLPHLQDVLGILQSGIDDPWTWAAWLNTPDATGLTMAERLRQGQWQEVCDLATEDAAAWSRP